MANNIDLKIKQENNLSDAIKKSQVLKKEINSIADAVNQSAMKFKSVDSILGSVKQKTTSWDNVIKKTTSNMSKVMKFDKGVNSITDAVNQSAMKFKSLDKEIESAVGTFNQKQQDKFNKSTKELGRIVKNNAVQVKSFADKLAAGTGPLLSMMFFGMMLKNTFEGALKSIFEGYKTAIGEGSKFNQLTLKLSANWEFFKFQLADTLANSPLFQKFMEFIIGIVQWFSKLDPVFKKIIIGAVIFLALLGGLLFIVGQLGLGMMGLVWATSAEGVAVLGMVGGFMLAVGAVLLFIALLGVLYKVNSDHLADMGLEVDGFWNNVKSIMTTFAAGVANIFVMVATTIVSLFLGVGGAIAGIIDGYVSAIWNVLSNLFDGIVEGLKAALSGKSLAESFKTGFKTAMKDFDPLGAAKTGFMREWDTTTGLIDSTIKGAVGIHKSINDWEKESQVSFAGANDVGSGSDIDGLDSLLNKQSGLQEQINNYNIVLPEGTTQPISEQETEEMVKRLISNSLEQGSNGGNGI